MELTFELIPHQDELVHSVEICIYKPIRGLVNDRETNL